MTPYEKKLQETKIVFMTIALILGIAMAIYGVVRTERIVALLEDLQPRYSDIN